MLQELGMREPLSCHPGGSSSPLPTAHSRSHCQSHPHPHPLVFFIFPPVFRAVCENILHTSHSGLVGLLRVRLHCFKLKLLCCRCSMHASHCRIPVPAPGPAPFSVPVPSAEASYFSALCVLTLRLA